MARSGHGADESPAAITAQGRSGSARPGAAGRGNRLTLALVGLGLVGHMMRSRRFYQRVTVAVIAVGALRGIGQDNRASAMARLSAWNKREMQRLERKADGAFGAAEGPGGGQRCQGRRGADGMTEGQLPRSSPKAARLRSVT